MTNREATKYINWMRDKFITNKPLEACDLAISALEKQTADKCCETCKYKSRSSQEIPCCDCYLATAYEDCYEAEEES